MFDKSERITILIIEDNPGDLLLVSTLIYGSGLKINEIISAERLSEAEQKLESQNADLILLDLTLPDSSGIDTFKAIKKVAGKIPVVILSGLTDMNLALEAITLGAQDYLIKGDIEEKVLTKTIVYSIERKRNIESLRESKERYDLASKATNDIIWDLDLATNKVIRNKGGWSKLGLPDTEEDLMDESWAARIHPDDAPFVRKVFEAKLSDPKTEIIELEYRIKDLSGDYLYISDRSFILRDENGKPIRVIGASQDITDRKKAEEVLRASEESYRYLFNNNPASIIIWDLTTYEILDVNETAIEQYGYSKEEFLHKSMLEIRNESERQTFIDFAAEAANKPDFRRSATWKHLDKFDNDIYMDISSHRIWFNGKYVMLDLANNITERVYLEQELEEERLLKQQEITNAIIAAQEQERSEMGTELHDNINQILATSRLYLDCAIADEKLRPKLLQDSRNYIVNAMSEIRKLSKSLLPPTLSKVGLIETLDDLVASLKPVNDITFNTDWAFFDESNVPDKLRLTIFRIVQEQLNNIQKHAKATLVYITLKQVNNEIDLEITDNGIGFDTNLKRQGVGLQNINTRANQHKGVLIVYSEPNKGCQLIVKFPFEQTPIEE